MKPRIVVSREEFLSKLKLVHPGIMAKGIIDLGNAFVMEDGYLKTYNGEIACFAKMDVGDITGAVIANPVIDMLEQMEEDEVELSQEKNKFTIYGRKRNKGARYDFKANVKAPVNAIEKPEKWKKLDEKFVDGLSLVQECASTKKANELVLTCIHIHPNWVEATDRYQVARFVVKTPIDKGVVVPKLSLRHAILIEPAYVAYKPGGSWIHFTDKSKSIRYSCCLEQIDFEKPSKAITETIAQKKGGKTIFPKGMLKALKRASIPTSEQANERERLTVNIKKTLVQLRAFGLSIEYFENMKIPKYDGKKYSFIISPNLLTEVLTRHTDCFLSERALRVEIGSFTYVAGLGAAKENEGGWK